jgi:hypothetical protein
MSTVFATPAQTLTLTDTVTPSGAAGTAAFSDGGTVLGTATLASGVGVLTTTAIVTPGRHSLTAAYGGNSTYTGSTSPAVEVIVPINRWLLSDGTGTSAADSAGSNALALTAVTWGSVFGFPGSAATFGSGSSAVAGSAGSTNFDGTTPFSLSIWAKMTVPATGAITALFSNMGAGPANAGFTFSVLQYGNFEVELINNVSVGPNAIAFRTTTPYPVTSGVLFNAVFTYDGSKTVAGCAVYYNGALQPQATIVDALTGSIASGGPVRIGAGANSTTAPTGTALLGTAADARVFSVCLTASEVADLYAAGVQ